jgi:hypothetical protein
MSKLLTDEEVHTVRDLLRHTGWHSFTCHECGEQTDNCVTVRRHTTGDCDESYTGPPIEELLAKVAMIFGLGDNEAPKRDESAGTYEQEEPITNVGLLAKRRRQADSAVVVDDMSKDGTGPWKVLINGYGIATWPWKHSYDEVSPKEYAEEVARVLRGALVTVERNIESRLSREHDNTCSALGELRAMVEAYRAQKTHIEAIEADRVREATGFGRRESDLQRTLGSQLATLDAARRAVATLETMGDGRISRKAGRALQDALLAMDGGG